MAEETVIRSFKDLRKYAKERTPTPEELEELVKNDPLRGLYLSDSPYGKDFVDWMGKPEQK